MVRRKNVPGPGTYEMPEFYKVGGQVIFNKSAKMGAAAFGSNQSRTDRSGGSASNCHPGQYTITAENAGVHTGKAEPMASRTARSHNVNANKGKSTFNSTAQRPASAPKGKAFGGPGEYDSSHLYSCGKEGTAMSSAFKSSLPANAHVRKSMTPGVGMYNPSVDCEHERPPSASFKGPARSTASGRSTTSTSLGPGSYDLSSGSISKNLSETRNPRAPAFNASSMRKLQQSGAGNNAVGPGQYENLGNETVTARSVRSFNKSAKAGAAAFGSNQSRTDRSGGSASNCHPGQYTITAENAGVHTGKAEPMASRTARSHNVNANKGKSTFNSTAQRPASAPKGKAFGGPGEYDSSHLYSCGKEGTAMSSAFKSSLPANAHVRKSMTPGVGMYNPSVDCEHERPPSASFKGPARSTASGRSTTSTSLGPGSYDLDRGISHNLFEKVKASKRAPPFNSSAPRDYWEE